MAFDDLDRAEQSGAETDRSAADEDDASEGGPTSDGDPTTAGTTDPARSDGPGTDRRPQHGERSSATDTDPTDEDPLSPAFEFEEARQRPLYARREAWDAFEDALAIEVEATLRGNDVRDAPKRELHDAALRVLADHADEVAERVLDARGVDRR